MRIPQRAARLLLSLCLLSACSSHRADFAFMDLQGRSLPLRRSAAEPYFRLPRRSALPADGRAFYLRYRELSRPVLLRLWSEDDKPIAEAILPASGGETLRKLVSLPRQALLTAFSLHPLSGEEEAAEPVILESGLGAELRGFSGDSQEWVLGTLIDGFSTSAGETLLRFRAGEEIFGAGEDWGLKISLEKALPGDPSGGQSAPLSESPPGSPPGGRGNTGQLSGGEIGLLFTAPGRSFQLGLDSASCPQTQTFYAGVPPFRPTALSILHPEIALRVTAAEMFPLPAAEEPPGKAALPPLAADPELMLRYDAGRWRGEDFELFAWNKFPEVLVFDTASYEVQDRYFKRLAFFVEKKGFRGRLVSMAEVQHLHGYNAHDYRAEDLATFFTRAVREAAGPSSEEAMLLQILLDSGVIRAADDSDASDDSDAARAARQLPGGGFVPGSFVPGRGAVLSVSRSSSPALRRHLLIHECLHGVFFASPAYRAVCQDVWNQLSGAERDFWELFLDWQGYDINDSFLVANELQAYVLQQPRGELYYYFQILTRDRLVQRYPGREAEIRSLVVRTGAGLQGVYERLEQALRQASALEGGRVSALSFPAEAAVPGE
jgi:hypothetical protein